MQCDTTACRLKSTRMEDLDFVIDTKASNDTELVQSFTSPFPVFSTSRYTLRNDDEKADSEKSEADEAEDDDEYFGKQKLKLSYLKLKLTNKFPIRPSTPFYKNQRCFGAMSDTTRILQQGEVIRRTTNKRQISR